MAAPTRYSPDYDFTGFQSANPNTPLPADKLEIELNNVELTTGEIITNLGLIQRSDGALSNGVVTYDSLNAAMKALLGTTMVPKGDWAATTAYEQLDLVSVGESTYIAVSDHNSGTSFTVDFAAGKWLLWANPGFVDGTSFFQKFSGDGTTVAFTVSQDMGTDENGLMIFINNSGWIPQDPANYTINGTTLTFLTAPPNASNNIFVFAPAKILSQAATYAAAAGTSASAAASSATAAAASATAAAASETNAGTSETNAGTSETNAASSASAAASSASAASTSASSASTSATAAASSATAAASSATAAASSATDAETAQTAAETAESNASDSAGSASTSATAAASSATAAASSATSAATQASNASASATAAATSAAEAAASAASISLIQTKTAAEDLADFEVAYINGSGTLNLADASAEATAKGALRLVNEAIANAASGEVLLPNTLKVTSGLTAGAVYYLSETAGAITVTPPSAPGTIVRVVGYAESATIFHFFPDNTYVEN